jgi:hypothetical protein
MLCNVCQKIFNYFNKDSNEEDHHSSPSELALAASQCCYICETLWRYYLSRKILTADNSSSDSSASQDSLSRESKKFCRYYLTYCSVRGNCDHDGGALIFIMNFPGKKDTGVLGASDLYFTIRPINGERTTL